MILRKDDLAKLLWDQGSRGSEENLEEVLKTEYGRWEITGCTYPLRDKLKSAGFEWDAKYKCWYTDNFDVAKFFV